jgi:hypothetical protein
VLNARGNHNQFREDLEVPGIEGVNSPNAISLHGRYNLYIEDMSSRYRVTPQQFNQCCHPESRARQNMYTRQGQQSEMVRKASFEEDGTATRRRLVMTEKNSQREFVSLRRALLSGRAPHQSGHVKLHG